MHLVLHWSRIMLWLTQSTRIPSISISSRIPITEGERNAILEEFFFFLIFPLCKVKQWDPLWSYYKA